jgi:hypothetical protein
LPDKAQAVCLTAFCAVKLVQSGQAWAASVCSDTEKILKLHRLFQNNLEAISTVLLMEINCRALKIRNRILRVRVIFFVQKVVWKALLKEPD